MKEDFDPSRPRPEDMIPENSRYALPSEAQIMIVTPEMASDWVSFRQHPKNRPVSPYTVDKYMQLMKPKDGGKPKWREASPEGLIFDTNGQIISAAHRLTAQANAGLTLRWWVFPNEPRELFEVVDQGYKRTAAHLLRIPYATNLASGARILTALADNDRFGVPRYSRLTTTEVVSTFHKFPELTWFASPLWAAYQGGGVPMGVHAAVMAQAARTEYREKIPEWLDQVAQGEALTKADPAWHLRRKFMTTGVTVKRGNSVVVLNYSLITKAWNTFAAGESMSVLKLDGTSPIPDVLDFPRAALAAAIKEDS